MTLVIRAADKSEVVALSDLAIETYREAFGHSFRASDLEAYLEKYLSPGCITRALDVYVILVAQLRERLAGYAQFGPAPSGADSPDAQELRRLYVHPDFQNRGIGTLLIEASLEHPQMKRAPSVCLDVWEHNIAALRFYRRFGFEVIGTRAFEVESGDETSLDLVMVRRQDPLPRLDR